MGGGTSKKDLEFRKGSLNLNMSKGLLGNGSSKAKKFGKKKRRSSTERTKLKVALLGTGGCGKSTVFRAFKMSKRGDGFPEGERKRMSGLMFRSIFRDIKRILDFRASGTLRTASMESDIGASGVIPKPADPDELLIYNADLRNLTCYDEALAEAAKRVWSRESFQKIVAAAKEKQIVFDHPYASVVLDNIEQVCSPNFSASDQDILHFRHPTTKLEEFTLDLDDATTLTFVDVGGQRTLRKSWDSLTDANAIIFVAALSDYEHVAKEDTTRNRLLESLSTFRVLVKRKFKDKKFILFLNKRDLFEQRIVENDITDCFPGYKEGCNYNAALNYIASVFRSYFDNPDDLYVYTTCATDKNQMDQLIEGLTNVLFSTSVEMTFGKM